MINTMHVPPAIRALAAAAGGRRKPATGPVAATVPSPRTVAKVSQSRPNSAKADHSKRPIPVRIVSRSAIIAYTLAMWFALAARGVAVRIRAFDGSFARRYWQATEFVGAHIQGVVTGTVADTRRAVCDECEFRKMVNDHDRCGAMDCGCSMRRWWAPTWLAWLRWLAGWACPRKKWAGGETHG